MSKHRDGYFDYAGPRTYFKDGYWWGLNTFYGAKFDSTKRLQKYPYFKYLEDIDEFKNGYLAAIRQHNVWFNMNLSDCWLDYTDLVEQWYGRNGRRRPVRYRP